MARRTPRIFGIAASGDYDPPDLVRHHPLANSDVQLLKSISKGLSQSGVTERKDEREPVAILEEVTEIFQDALSYAKYEKELNEDFYRPEVEALVAEREAREGDTFSDPSLDGVDDYGRQMYESEEERKRSAPMPVMPPKSRPSLAENGPGPVPRFEPEPEPEPEPEAPRDGTTPLKKLENSDETDAYEALLARLSVPISYVD